MRAVNSFRDQVEMEIAKTKTRLDARIWIEESENCRKDMPPVG